LIYKPNDIHPVNRVRLLKRVNPYITAVAGNWYLYFNFDRDFDRDFDFDYYFNFDRDFNIYGLRLMQVVKGVVSVSLDAPHHHADR
jgi:hypothetical protein